MKKFISVLASSVLIAGMTAAPLAANAEKYGDKYTITVLGDSISEGYGLAPTEYTYGAIVADYLGGSVENYAVSGYHTSDTLEQIRNMNAAEKAQLAASDTVIISVGANDMIEYVAGYMLKMCADLGCLKGGMTADDIPANPSLTDIYTLIDRPKLGEYASNMAHIQSISLSLQTMRMNLTATDADQNGDRYEQILAKVTIPTIKEIAAEIKAVNPDARILFQNVYNPFEFETGYKNANFSSSFRTVMGSLESTFALITKDFSKKLSAVEGIEVVDVMKDFSSYELTDDFDEYFYGWYFTNIQLSGEERDIHPTQAGHVAIASAVLNTLGAEKHESSGILEYAFAHLPDPDNYPAVAKENYVKIAADYKAADYALGDIDNSGKVDSSDASFALIEYAALSIKESTTFTPEQRAAGDVNKDGKVDATDASKILEYYAYLSTTKGDTLPMDKWTIDN